MRYQDEKEQIIDIDFISFSENYKKIKNIGEGGFGEVYEVQPLKKTAKGLKQKSLAAKITKDNPPEDIIEEVRILSKMNNPYIVKCDLFFSNDDITEFEQLIII